MIAWPLGFSRIGGIYKSRSFLALRKDDYEGCDECKDKQHDALKGGKFDFWC